MVGTAAITVRRQVLDVELHGTESEGLALQRRLPGVCAHVLWPALESAFAPGDPGDAHLIVERLAIDVSGISLDHLDEQLADAVQREVADYLRLNPAVPFRVAELGKSGDVQRRTVAETVDEALVVFLRTGRLPWSFRMPPGTRLEQLVVDAWGAANADRGPPPAMRARLSEILAAPSARARVVMQFSPGFVATVLRGVSPQLGATTMEVLDALDAAPSSSPAGAVLVRRVWEAALVAAAAGRRPGPDELARTAWRQPSAVERDDRTLATALERDDGKLAAALERRWPGVTEGRDAPRGRDHVEASPPMPAPPPGDLGEEAGGLLVDNAGVVLLHPFLPRLFDGLGVAAGDELVDPGRALCLLHHLATGELTAPEHQLTLAKVLCGVALDEPAEADVGLTDVETAEAIAVLDAAIGHWGALGGSAPDALRGEFLMRPGMLAVDADGDWLLRVEARTADILLDQLPWGVSLVKLPWMDRLLRVEWW
jgi:Contractile injection system tape measure protein